MIIVTGAAGFIGSNMIRKLNDSGYQDIVAIDDFSRTDKNKNLQNKKIHQQIDREEFIPWLTDHGKDIDFIFHIGARTDTSEFNKAIFDHLNLNYSKAIWKACVKHNIPLLYASSAATYGGGEFGYKDDHELPFKLQPLNPYGESKNEFDKWVLNQTQAPDFWAGVKFFNVYGPNEYHKGRMASVIFHCFNQVRETGKMKLFRSHRNDYKDGEQLRDFIYIKDVTEILIFFMKELPKNGLFNIGTGKARSFNDLARNTIQAMNAQAGIEYIDTPEDIRDKYQYFTEADISKLKQTNNRKAFYSLEDGIADYVKNYLIPGNYQ